MTRFWRSLLSLLMWFALNTSPGYPQGAPPPEARALIERQLDAFARDDAEGAYALAAPAIKALFPDAATFMDMVKSTYTPVYRHRSVDFGPATQTADEIDQVVTLVDAHNEVWTAIYRLARQPDGGWLTTGCILRKSSQSSL